MNIASYIVIAIIVVALFFAIRGSVKGHSNGCSICDGCSICKERNGGKGCDSCDDCKLNK